MSAAGRFAPIGTTDWGCAMKPGTKGGERVTEMPSIYKTFLDALPQLTQQRWPALAHRRLRSTPWTLATRAAAVLLLSIAWPFATVGSDPSPADVPARAVWVADAGQAVHIQGAQLQVQHRTRAELESRTAWATGWLTFHGEPLFEVVHTLNQHNRRQVVIADPSIAQLPVGGRFHATDLEAMIKALTSVLPVRVLPDRSLSQSNLIRLVRAQTSPVSSPLPSVPTHPST